MSFSAAEDGIRSYGPGKFYTVLDSYVHEFTLDGGVDEEAGSGEGNGWYGLVRLDDGSRKRIREIAAEEKDELTEEEEDLLNDNVVVILFERSDGIVEADWFDKKREAEKAWAGIEEEMADIEGEEEDEEEDD